MALAAALKEMPEAPGARAALFELLRDLQLSAREQELRKLDFAIGAVLARLERDGFDQASLGAVRDLAKRFEFLASQGETGTRPRLRVRRPTSTAPEPANQHSAPGPANQHSATGPANQHSATRPANQQRPTGSVPAERAAPASPQAMPGQGSAQTFNLRGRRVLVADDDPEVRWFYVALLKEAGVNVYEASDGLGAMDIARVDPPDVILADILMPELDGLGLCEAVRREPRLDGVPVVLLSWRQDFVHRMRELRVEAQGYLRKEASAQQVLERVAEVLEPQTRLENSLCETAEVRGDLEKVGVAMLFRAVRAYRPTAQVVLQDPWSLFEAHFWNGTLVYLRRTAIDGTVSSGVAALPGLVGMGAGRFVVAAGPASSGPGPEERDLEEAFIAATEKLSRTIGQLAGAGERRVTFHESALGLYVRHSPESVRVLVARLAAGESPRSLWESGETSRALVDALLIALARQGVIEGVEGSDASLGNVGRGTLPAPHSADAEADTEADWETDAQTELYRATAPAEPRQGTGQHREDLRVQAGVAMHRGPVNAAPKLTDSVERPMVAAVEGSGVMADMVGLPQMKSGPGLLGWAFVALLSATAGFLAFRIVMPAPEQGELTAPAEPVVSAAGQEPSPEESAVQRLGLSAFSGRLLPGVSEDSSSSQGQGVLQLRGDAEVQVTVDGVDRGALPIALPLAEGRHEVRYRVGDDWSHRFYFVKAGYTRELRVSVSPGGFVDAR